MWRRIILAAAVGLVPAVVTPVPAAAAAPPPQPAQSAPEQTCDQVLKQAQRAVLASGKSGTVPCTRRVSSSMMAPGASTEATTEAYCGSGSWSYTRKSSCLGAASYVTDVITIPDEGVPYLSGQIWHTLTIENVTSGVSSRWTSRITITIGVMWGTVSGSSVFASAECGANCGLVGSGFDGGLILSGYQRGGTAQFSTTSYGLGTIWRAWSNWRWWFSNPGWLPTTSPSAVIAGPAHRCDEAVGILGSIGCVFDNVVPIHEIGRTRWPKYARHIELAINFGLPRVLTRTQISAQQEANRNIACPSSKTPANGWSCDEYPYASTKEGAANPMHPYGRTFQILNWNSGYPPFFCGIGWLNPRQLGDSLGYSVCGIPLEENRGSGTDLGLFYIDNRVLHDDRFEVKIVA